LSILHGKREVIALIDTSSFEEATSMYPECDWKFFILAASCRTNNIQVQTIFRDLEMGNESV
jgi:hypothetical protein